jgi:regulatory protein
MPPTSCYDKAVQLLAARPHFREELAAKLEQRGYPAGDIAAALDRLTEQGYVDDRAAARGFVESRRGRGEGRARLRAELLRRGASEEAADAALAELTPADDLPAAQAAAARWESRGGRDARALARHLERKGFSRRAIVAVLSSRADALDIDGGS